MTDVSGRRTVSLATKAVRGLLLKQLSRGSGRVWAVALLILCGVICAFGGAATIVGHLTGSERWASLVATRASSSCSAAGSADNLGGRSFADRLCSEMPIDAVYTWVNGSDPAWFARMAHYRRLERGLNSSDAEADGGAAPKRYRDNGELRYSMRSLFKYAPWLRSIILVTDNQVPAWLDTNHPRVRLVTHEEIFANASHLPVFSSPAIEANLHRIPGLSRHWLYFNDDVMLGAPVWPDDFYSRTHDQTLYLAYDAPPCNAGCVETWIGDGYCDILCNTTLCMYDAGDCANGAILPSAPQTAFETTEVDRNRRAMPAATDACAPGCPGTRLGDGVCDAACGGAPCAADSGDCGWNAVRSPTSNITRVMLQMTAAAGRGDEVGVHALVDALVAVGSGAVGSLAAGSGRTSPFACAGSVVVCAGGLPLRGTTRLTTSSTAKVVLLGGGVKASQGGASGDIATPAFNGSVDDDVHLLANLSCSALHARYTFRAAHPAVVPLFDDEQKRAGLMFDGTREHSASATTSPRTGSVTVDENDDDARMTPSFWLNLKPLLEAAALDTAGAVGTVGRMLWHQGGTAALAAVAAAACDTLRHTSAAATTVVRGNASTTYATPSANISAEGDPICSDAKGAALSLLLDAAGRAEAAAHTACSAAAMTSSPEPLDLPLLPTVAHVEIVSVSRTEHDGVLSAAVSTEERILVVVLRRWALRQGLEDHAAALAAAAARMGGADTGNTPPVASGLTPATAAVAASTPTRLENEHRARRLTRSRLGLDLAAALESLGQRPQAAMPPRVTDSGGSRIRLGKEAGDVDGGNAIGPVRFELELDVVLRDTCGCRPEGSSTSLVDGCWDHILRTFRRTASFSVEFDASAWSAPTVTRGRGRQLHEELAIADGRVLRADRKVASGTVAADSVPVQSIIGARDDAVQARRTDPDRLKHVLARAQSRAKALLVDIRANLTGEELSVTKLPTVGKTRRLAASGGREPVWKAAVSIAWHSVVALSSSPQQIVGSLLATRGAALQRGDLLAAAAVPPPPLHNNPHIQLQEPDSATAVAPTSPVTAPRLLRPVTRPPPTASTPPLIVLGSPAPPGAAPDAYAASLVYTNRLFARSWASARRIRRVPAHMPHFVSSDTLEAMHRKWPTELAATSSHRFRSDDDVQFAAALMWFVLEGGAREGVDVDEYWAAELDTDGDGMLSLNELRTLTAVVHRADKPGWGDAEVNELRACITGSSVDSTAGTSTGVPLTLARVLDCPLVMRGLARNIRFPRTHTDAGPLLEEVGFEMLHDDLNRTAAQLDSLRGRKPKFVCINDDVTNAPLAVTELLHAYYESMFPHASPVELAPGRYNAEPLTVSAARLRAPSTVTKLQRSFVEVIALTAIVAALALAGRAVAQAAGLYERRGPAAMVYP